MRYILLFFLIFSTLGDNFKKASRVNNGVQRANNLYNQQQYQQAASLYQFLNDSLHVNDGELNLNLAHATYQAGNLKQARKYYLQLRTNKNTIIQAAALNQLGIISFNDHNPEKALYYFKKAIIQNPVNDVARFNYELVLKYVAQNPIRKANKKAPPKPKTTPNQTTQNQVKPSQTGTPDLQNSLENSGTESPQDKPQQNPDKQPTENNIDQKPVSGTDTKVAKGNSEGADKGITEAKNGPDPGLSGKGGNEAISQKEKQMQTLRERLSKTDLSAEKANMLLEAMRQAELQYLQQLPRQPTYRPDKNKPDW